MSTRHQPLDDPILASLPEIRGRRVLKPCVLYARLGRGGMGAVYLGKHLTLMQKQVVKCLWLMGSGNPSDSAFVDRFQQEARIAAEMTHQNLVRVTHVDRLGELHYLVMEYVEGEDCARRVERSGPMDEETALTVLLGAARGLGYAHARGIVHRDVKPANLMISAHGEVKVIDLGLARAIDSTRQLGATIGTLGTPLYMAPEQWQSANVDATADVWALGAVLYFLLTGRSPIPEHATDTATIRKLAAEASFVEAAANSVKVSRGARRILRRCLAHDPTQRFADARELADALTELVSGDERLLVDPHGVPPVVGDEPGEDELRALQAVLAQREAQGPGVLEATLPDRPFDDTLPAVVLGPTLPMQAGGSATPPSGSPLTTARPSTGAPRRRRQPKVLLAVAAATTLMLGSAGVVLWPRTDYAAVQKEAMAAIYQERFADADRLLVELEAAPAFADQARRMRIDALQKHAQLRSGEDPVAALRLLATADEVAGRLLLANDIADARARLQTARQPLAAAVQQRMAESLSVHNPLPGAVITRSRQPVSVRFAPGGLELVASIQGRPLTQEQDDIWRGEWQAPDTDGPCELTVAVELPDVQLRHVVTVPVEVRRGAVALHVVEPSRPSNLDELQLEAGVDNGPLDVICTVTAPDGRTEELQLGSHDGDFRVAVPCRAGVDGSWRLRLSATVGEQRIQSPECVVQVDRRAPTLGSDGATRHTGARTVLLQGHADEPCQVFVIGNEALAVATDAQLAFAVPLTLPADEGPLQVRLAARDAAGNVTAAPIAIEVIVDRTAPHFVADSLEHADGAAGERIEVRGRLDEPGVVGDDELQVATDDDGAFSVAVLLPPGAIEQPATLRLVARDRAGNRAEPANVTVFVDRTGPRILPGAPDGSWWAEGYWQLKVEDHSAPCRLTLGSETQEVAADGTVRFVRRASTSAVVVTAQDRLGNRSSRTLSGPGVVETGDAPVPGPSWGEAVPGSAIDPELHLYERVAVTLCGQRLVLRLVRPLRDEELPPRPQRDPRAVALLQGQAPYYLAETELPAAVWQQWLASPEAAATAAAQVFRFDPDTCQWQPRPNDAAAPLHPTLLAAGDAAQRADLPATGITPEAARAFCAHHGLRLPSESEWLFVTRMGTRSRYGWLPDGPLEQRANLADLRLQALAPKLAAFDTVDDGFAALASVDAFPAEAQRHPWGFRNLLGNVAEWCTTGPKRAVAVGGSWLSEPFELRVDQPRRDRAITSGAWDCVGLRVAKDL